MDLKLQGKRALVTGSSAGIGQGVAIFLAREGCTVAVHGRNAQRVDEVVAEIVQDGGKALPVYGPLDTDDAARHVAAAALQALGGVDILVANAGGRNRKDEGNWSNTTPQDFVATYQINVGSTVRLVQDLVGGMKDQAWGRIILISSVAAAQPKANSVPDYSTSKAAIVNMGLSLAKWLHDTGITVNTISPGVIASDAIRGFMTRMADSRGWPKDWPSLEARAVKDIFKVPVGRIGQPEDIAAAVALLSSDLGGFFHGCNLRIDGGAVGVVN